MSELCMNSQFYIIRDMHPSTKCQWFDKLLNHWLVIEQKSGTVCVHLSSPTVLEIFARHILGREVGITVSSIVIKVFWRYLRKLHGTIS